MAVLLVVHHTPSPSMQAMLEAALAGARDPDLAGIEVVVRPALGATVPDVLAADGFVLGTPANIGYMSGALKHFFDTVYYPCLQAKTGAPYGLYVHGASDTTGAVRAVTSIAKGLGWSEVVKPVIATGEVAKQTEQACYELAATVAANLLLRGLRVVPPGCNELFRGVPAPRDPGSGSRRADRGGPSFRGPPDHAEPPSEPQPQRG